MRKIKTKIEFEFHPDDIPEIPIEIFKSFTPKINKNIKTVKLVNKRRDGSTGFRKNLF